jgi:hypothetical protein
VTALDPVLESAERIGHGSLMDPYADVPPPAEPPGSVTPLRPTSWQPVDLSEILTAGYRSPTPTVGRRSDGRGILYAGRTHSLNSQSEDGKSWCAQHLSQQELEAGNAVVYLDFEDDAAAVAGRMMTLGALPDWLSARFAYIAPQEPITSGRAQADLMDAMRELRPTFVVIDGVTEALAMHGLSTLDNDDLAKFGRLVTRPLADAGAAVLSLDHVTKDAETRGRYAIGGVHKLNGLSGAAFTLQNVARFGEGMAGRSRLLIAKDRPGQLRPHALPGAGDRWWYADFTLDTGTAEPAEFVAPVEHTQPFMPTLVMAKVSAALLGAPGPLSVRGVIDRVTGKQETTRQALAALVDGGYVRVTSGPRGSQMHELIKSYPSEDE